MRHLTHTPLVLAGLFSLVGLWAGCIVGYDVESDEHEYYCEEDDDCIDGYECNEDTNVCSEIGGEEEDEGPPCDDSEDGIDQDGDGYGTGDDRSECEHGAPDCDDSDPDVYPGAPELCDGKANDCKDWDDQDEPPEEAIDDFSCDGSPDCSGMPAEDDDVYDGFTSDCSDEGVCILVPQDSDRCEEAADMELSCDSEAEDYTWENSQGEEMTAADCPE